MQPFGNAISLLPVPAGNTDRDVAGSLGPKQPGTERSENQSDQGFERVLQGQAPRSESRETGEHDASQTDGSGSGSAQDASHKRDAQQSDGERADNTASATASREDGKAIPPTGNGLPPGSDASGEEASSRNTIDVVLEGDGADPEQAIALAALRDSEHAGSNKGKGTSEAVRNGLVSNDEAAGKPVVVVQPGTTAVTNERAAMASLSGEETAEQAKLPGSNRLDDGETVALRKDSDLRIGQDGKPAAAERAASELARSVTTQTDSETPTPRRVEQVAVPLPAAEAAGTNVTRQGIALQAGSEALFGARIAVGQDGWNQLIAQRIANLAARGANGAEIQLDPPELGPIKVTIQMLGDQQASVTVQSHSQAVRDALEQGAQRLRDLFNQSGLDLATLDVSDHGLSQGREDAPEERGSAGDPVGAGPEAEAPSPEDAMAVTMQVPASAGQIDFYI